MPKVCPVCGTNYPDSNIFCPADGSTLRAADPDGDLIGSVIADRYLVTDLLGEGGMGKVFLARHVRLPLQAAIKVLRSELLKDPAAVARFNREAANASSIEHERVARVFDFGETPDGLVYLAMEYVNGPTLKKIINSEGPLELVRTANIVRQIAEGLDAAHRMNIVHRDLKPDNILVQSDVEGGDRCKVVDFGIAKAIGGNDTQSGLTQTGFVVGTPEFMSPEQVLGGEIDHRSDVFSLALVAFQCLTQDLPFDSKSPDRGLTARLVSEPRKLSTVKPEISWPIELQAVFDRALEREPENRTASAGVFAREFSAAVTAAEKPALLPTAISSEIPSEIPAALPAMVPSAELPAISIARSGSTGSGSASASVLASGANDAAITATKTSSRRSWALPAAGLLAVLAAGGWWLSSSSGQGNNSDPDTGIAVVSPALPGSSDRAGQSGTSSGNASDGGVAANPMTAGGQTGAGAANSGQGSSSGAGAASRSDAGAGASSDKFPAEKKPVEPPAGGTRTAPVSRAVATLDSITKALDPGSADEGDARAAVPVLKALLPRLTTNTDSTWTYIRIAEAFLLLNEQKPACDALRNARNTARSMAQAEIINGYSSQLRCAPAPAPDPIG